MSGPVSAPATEWVVTPDEALRLVEAHPIAASVERCRDVHNRIGGRGKARPRTRVESKSRRREVPQDDIHPRADQRTKTLERHVELQRLPKASLEPKESSWSHEISETRACDMRA